MISSNVLFDREAKLQARFGVDAFGPAGDDPHDQLVGLARMRAATLSPGDAPQRLDLLADRAADARHREIDAGAELFAA